MKLTALCLKFNPANYTIWWYRRKCLSTLSKQDDNYDGDETVTKGEKKREEKATYYSLQRIKSDLELASELGGSNPKNYQIWYHRRSLLEYQFEYLRDMNFDPKNCYDEGNEGYDFGDDDCDGGENNNDRGLNNGIQIARNELNYISSVLDEDGKNYHVSFTLYVHNDILLSINVSNIFSIIM